MKLIAHRGNTEGPSPLENNPQHIQKALNEGYDVEIDLWKVGNELWLGHDSPSYLLSNERFLADPRVWVHAKNLEAAYYLSQHVPECNFFYHQTDDFVLTSKGYFWTYFDKPICSKSVIVSRPEDRDLTKYSNAYGVCTDYCK